MLALRNVTAGYGSTTVLRDVSVCVPAGSIVALIGPNGAGKTTLLRVASGLLHPSAGEVRLDGRLADGWRPERLAREGVCHVPEGRGIFRALSVHDNILLACGGNDPSSAIERAASVFPVLGKRLDQKAGTLSGGEQQMLALVRSYLSNPRYVLLDEVSLGLAPRIVDEIFEFLQRLAADGAALLLVEQYVVRALEMATFVYTLHRGRVVFAGEPQELDIDEVFRSYVGATG